MTDKEVMQQALEQLVSAVGDISSWASYASTYFQNKHDLSGNLAEYEPTIEALRTALAQPKPEPVAYITKRKVGGSESLLFADYVDMSEKNKETHHFIPLYTAPPQRKPLSK